MSVCVWCQDSLEEVLAWLLGAEQTLHKQPEIASDVQLVKDQFHQHEVGTVWHVVVLYIYVH